MRRRFLERYNGLKLGWLRDSIHFIVLVAAVFVIFRYVIGLAVVGGNSMDPTLRDGNVLVYLRTVSEYRQGDVVSIRVPAGEYYVKRVAATGGQSVDIADGELYIDGAPEDSDYAVGSTYEESGAVIYPYEVREGNVFVLGDNREVSLDSRTFGEISRRQIKGKIIISIGKNGVHIVR